VSRSIEKRETELQIRTSRELMLSLVMLMLWKCYGGIVDAGLDVDADTDVDADAVKV
jgi:hypothetical protein